MAELVGDAYIRITADTTVMKRALKAQMKEAGEDGGKAFSDEVAKQSKGIAKGVERDFAKAFADPKVFDKMAKQFDGVEHAAKDFNKQLDIYIEQGKVASKDTEVFRNAIKNWEKQAIKTRDAAKKLNDEHAEALGINKRLNKEQKEQARQLRIVYERDHGEAMRMLREESSLRRMVLNRDHSEALKMLAAEAKAVKDALAKEAAENKKFNDDMERKLKQDHDWQVAEAYRMNARLDAAMKANEATAKKWRQQALDGEKLKWAQRIRVERDALKEGGAIEEGMLWERLQRNIDNDRRIAEEKEKIGKKSDRDTKLRYSALGRWLGRVNKKTDAFSVKVGKAFGKGSRNDFINIIGSMAGGFAKLGAKLAAFPLHLLGAFTDGFSAFFTTLKEGGNILQAGGAGIGAFVKGIGFAVPALIAAAGALFLFGEVIPAVVSGLSLLAGAVVATASAISYGLIGGLLAIGPAALGAAAGLGGLFTVFQSFVADKTNKDFMDDFKKPFEDFNKSHWPEVRTFLTNVKGGYKALIKDISPAVTSFFTSWKTNMNDPSTKKGLNEWSDSLGRMATTFNTTLPNALSGIIGFFRPILPYAEKIATAIGDAFVQFDKWANSEPGQNAIADFMKTAWADANKVWLILVDIKDIIFTVFEQGEPVGGGILDGVHSKLQDIIKWLQDPNNDGKIKKWFENAGQMAADVGELAGHLGDIIIAFNSEEGQKNAHELMTTINTIGAGAAKIATLADNIGSVMGWLEKVNNFLSLDPAEGLGGWLHDKIYGKDKKPEKPVAFKPQQIATVDPKKALQGKKDLVETYRVTISPQTKMGKEQLQAIEDFQIKDKTITIKGNEALWAQLRNTTAAYVFTPKQITIKGNETLWNQTKGTIAGFVFKPKVVKIVPYGDEVYDWVAQWNAHTIQTKTARVVVSVSKGGGKTLGGGLTVDAAGGYYDRPGFHLIGEAGPEAVVPLDRPLSMVDPAVRQLSAFAQGLSGPKGLPAAGPRVQFSEGAIQVNLPTGDPKLAAEAVLDRLVAYIG